MAGPEDRVTVIDVQVVSALQGLGIASSNKINYYKGNASLIANIAERFGVAADSVSVMAATISWKGVWVHALSGTCEPWVFLKTYGTK